MGGPTLAHLDTLLAYIQGTTTTTGLKVDAFRHDGCYETGRTVAQGVLDALNLERHSVPELELHPATTHPGYGRSCRRTGSCFLTSPKIAHILSTVDDLIERTEALIAKYRGIKPGLMHDLLTRGVDTSGRMRPSREEAPGLYRESALGWVPREWDESTLGEQFTLQRGLTITQGWSDLGLCPSDTSSRYHEIPFRRNVPRTEGEILRKAGWAKRSRSRGHIGGLIYQPLGEGFPRILPEVCSPFLGWPRAWIISPRPHGSYAQTYLHPYHGSGDPPAQRRMYVFLTSSLSRHDNYRRWKNSLPS